MDINTLFIFALASLKKAKTANERIDNLPLPMVFKGTLGTGGTISTLPTASSASVYRHYRRHLCGYKCKSRRYFCV